MFRPEDYLPPQEQGGGREALVEAPNDEQLLQDVLMSECPRCGQVGRHSNIPTFQCLALLQASFPKFLDRM